VLIYRRGGYASLKLGELSDVVHAASFAGLRDATLFPSQGLKSQGNSRQDALARMSRGPEMETQMNRSILVCVLTFAAAASLAAQQAGQSGAYQGTSNPPSNDTIISDPPVDAAPAPVAPVAAAPAAKPSAARYEQTQDQVQAQTLQPAAVNAEAADGTDGGIVQIAPDQPAGPGLSQRAADPDGDIVHPAPLGPNELADGTSIRVRLLTSVSTNFSQEGEAFRSTVASDVVQDDHVLIPAGSEIDGRITHVSRGGFGGHGSMNLVPETVILPDGSRFRMYGQVTATPGSNARVGSEGSINPGSHLKRDSIEYGGAVGAGAVTGAILGGPAGALAGSLVGAGVITAHLLISHPQAELNEGTYLQFMLTQRLNLVPATANGN